MRYGTTEYVQLHKWMAETFPKTGRCEECDSTDHLTEYASIGHIYTRDRADWREVCSRCHGEMDRGVKRFSAETRARLKTRGFEGRTHSADARAKMSAAPRPKYGPQSPELRTLRGWLKWQREHETIMWACGG